MKRLILLSFIMLSLLLFGCQSDLSSETTDPHLSLQNNKNTDKWGITLLVDDLTPKGLTLKIEQSGGNPSGELQMGAAYVLETTVNDKWQPVETITGNPLVWNMLGYIIKMNDITEMNIDWQNGYGELKPGFYRLKKEITDFRAPGDYDKETYEVYFNIE